MTLRELIFDVTFRGNTGPLSRTNTAVDNLSKKLDVISNKANKLGNSLMLKMTAPITLAGGKIIKTAMNFESAMSEVKAISGASGKEFDALKKKAREMGATTQFSASQSAEALKYMAMAGWSTDKMIAALPGVMNLAAASGESLGTVSDIVTDSMTAFGLKASEAGRFSDVLAQASSKSNTKVSLMGETFKYVAPVAGALKYSIEDTAIAVGLMANSGIKGSQAGTALRGAMSNMVKPTKEMQNAMNKLGISVTDSQGKMKPFKTVMDDMRRGFSKLSTDQRAYYANVLFGDTAMSGMLGIINATTEDYDALTKSIYGASGAALRQSEIMQDNLQGDFNKLKSAVEEISLQIGEILVPKLRKGTQYVTELVNRFGKLDDNTKMTILKIIGLAAAIGPLIKVFGFAASGVSIFLKTLSFLSKINIVFPFIRLLIISLFKLRTAFVALRVMGLKGMLFAGLKTTFVTLGTTILPVVAAIGLLVAAGYLLYTNWAVVKAKGLEFIGSLKEKFNSFVPDIMAIWENLKQIFISLLPVFAAVLGGILGGLGSFIKSVTNIIGSVIKVFKGITDFLVGVFTGDWGRAWNGILGIFTGIIDTIKGIFQGVIDFFKSVLGGFLGGIDEGKIAAESAKQSFSGPKPKTVIPQDGPRRVEIPHFAKGVSNFGGGLAIVGEKGPELVNLPRGSSVKTNAQTKDILSFDNKAYDYYYDKTPVTSSNKNVHVVFSPTVNVTTNSDNPYEIADVSKDKIRQYFEEFIEEADLAS
jgi:phage tail tape measure protein, TP901 family|nr:MAG TPA: minor tail protein [Caudoviricetes sp.]